MAWRRGQTYSQDLRDRVLHHGLVLLKLLEHGGFLEAEPDEDRDDNQDDARQEGYAPQPALEHFLVGQCHEGESACTQECAELDANEGQGSEEPATAARILLLGGIVACVAGLKLVA